MTATASVALLVAGAALVAARRLATLAARPRPDVPGSARRRPWVLRFERRRQTPAGDVELAEWCEHVARAVRAGSSLPVAVTAAGDRCPRAAAELAPATHAMARGRSLADALDVITADPASAVGLVVPVLSACAELGGPSAAALERTAATLQARAAERAERHVSSAQARLSARVLTTLPVGMLVLLAVTEPSVVDALRTPAGLICSTAGASLNFAGWWWMRRLIAASG